MKYHINPETMKAGICRAKHGCRFKIDEAEHYSSKEDAQKAIEKTLAEQNKDFGKLTKNNSTTVSHSNYSKIDDIPFDQSDMDAEVERLNALVVEKNENEILSTIETRGLDETFQKALKDRDNLYALSQELSEDTKKVRDGIRKGENTYVDLREAVLRQRDVNEHLASLNNSIHKYRGVTARYAEAYSMLRENRQMENGEFLTYDADTIGDLVAGGEYESGSPEWHAQREGGIGGSDVAKIMLVDKKYGEQEFRELLLKKVGLNDGNDTDLSRNDYDTAVGRGNAWEETIRHMYADRNPDKNVAFCKTSWEGVGEQAYRHANFDGLELDDNGVPTGIIEIKTGIHTDKWGSTEDGYAGMPENYRKQALWYAHNAGLKDVTLVAVLDDYDYREYKFSMDDPRAVQEVKDIEKATSGFWKDVEKHKNELANGIDNVSPKTSMIKGFPKTLVKKRVVSQLAVYSGDTPYNVARKYDTVMKHVNRKDHDQVQEGLTKLYASYDPADKKRPFIGIDIETNSASSAKGRIIETGIVSLANDGSTKVEYSSLHGVSDKVMRGAGAGSEEVHKINADMLKGKKPFEDADTQKEILAHLKKGTIVAHNASFEKEWLSVNLNGFAEALDKKQVRILDTKQLTSHLMDETESNTLETFAESNGVAYEGAHAATTDTRMMMEALGNFRKSLFNNGEFVGQTVSAANRKKAAKNVER